MIEKIRLSASVKVAKAAVDCSNAVRYSPIPIYPGEDEIALLLASNWILENTVANRLEALIWRKSISETKAGLFTGFAEDEDVIDYERAFQVSTTAVGIWQGVVSRYKTYPYPLVLIRPPQLATLGLVATTGQVVVTCYYVLQRVTKEQLARLMVKDHS